MIIGSGLVANSLADLHVPNGICLFASGVSDSQCQDTHQFLRERELLAHALSEFEKVIYFSSQALNGETSSPYYNHKREMEEFIISVSENNCILRLPQVCGPGSNERQLLPFLYKCVNNGLFFNCYKESVRNLIPAASLPTVVSKILQGGLTGLLHFCSAYDYYVSEIVAEFEYFCGKRACKSDISGKIGNDSPVYLCSDIFINLRPGVNFDNKVLYLRSLIIECFGSSGNN